MRKFILMLSLIISFQYKAQNKLPLIRAKSDKAYIVDGKAEPSDWFLSPSAKPDVYVCDRTRKDKWLVLHTDIDSIRVKVKPGTVFNFIILLNNKDSCYTQIRSAIPLDGRSKKVPLKSDTMDFTLNKKNAICVKAIINEKDTLNLHLDLGSFDFRLTKNAILSKTHLLKEIGDSVAGKTKINFNDLTKVYNIRIGKLDFNNPEVSATTNTAEGLDGRFGWNIFEGKVLEINYDKHIIVVHSRVPKMGKGYSKEKIEFVRSFPCVNANFSVAKQTYEGLFLLDTGSDLAVVIDSSVANKLGRQANLKVIKNSVFKDPRGNIYQNRIVLLPNISFNRYNHINVPACLLNSNNPTGLCLNFFGNDFLKRFNLFFDFSSDIIHLQPNGLFEVPYGG